MMAPAYLPYYVLTGTAGIVLAILYGLNRALALAGWASQQRTGALAITATVLLSWIVTAIALALSGAFSRWWSRMRLSRKTS